MVTNSNVQNGEIVSIEWQVEQNNNTSSISFSAAGIYIATLIVTYNNGETISDEIVITVVTGPVIDNPSPNSGGRGYGTAMLSVLIVRLFLKKLRSAYI